MGMELVTLKGDPRELPCPFCHVSTVIRWLLGTRRQALSNTKSAFALILDFPSSRLGDINVVYKPPSLWYAIIEAKNCFKCM